MQSRKCPAQGQTFLSQFDSLVSVLVQTTLSSKVRPVRGQKNLFLFLSICPRRLWDLRVALHSLAEHFLSPTLCSCRWLQSCCPHSKPWDNSQLLKPYAQALGTRAQANPSETERLGGIAL